MANSLYPAFIRINYHSPYMPHTMTIPTLAWDDGGGAYGQFDAHDATSIDADTMITLLTDELVGLWPNTAEIENAVIYTMASPTAEPVAQRTLPINAAGTSVTTGWDKAVQQTMTFATSLGGVSKLVFLDVKSNNNFDRNTSLAGVYGDIAAQYMAMSNGFAGRDGGRPSAHLQNTTTLNEALRRAYRMT